MKSVVVIPARLESSRCPEKILLDLGGKTVIERVHDACKKASDIEDIWIAVDCSKVLNHCKTFTDKVILTKKDHKNGTERIIEAVSNIDADIVLNVQADEPMINPIVINSLSKELKKNKQVEAASSCCSLKNIDQLNNTNVVKVINDVHSNAIYFSRNPIPYNRDNTFFEISNYKKHIGIYAYRKKFLQRIPFMEESFLEDMEKLEQLKFIENGYKIRMIEVEDQEIGIDTIEDYKYLKNKYFNNE